MIIKTLITLLLSCSVAMAGQGMGPGPGVKGYAASGDYTPSTVLVKFGTNSTVGTAIKVMIYSSGTLLCTSSPITKSMGNEVSADISGCGALTPGNSYVIAWVGNGYVPMSYDTSPTYMIQKNTVTGNYTTPPGTLPAGSNIAPGEAAFRVRNAAGTLLIGDADFSDNTNVANNGLELDGLGYTGGGYTCVTL